MIEVKIITLKDLTFIGGEIDNKQHIVCPADANNELLKLQTIKVGLSPEKTAGMCQMVNTRNEVGCLFPKCNVSLYPSMHNARVTIAMLNEYFKDILEANEKHFKTQEMIILYEQYLANNVEEFQNALEYFLQENMQKIQFLRIVSII